MVALVVGESLGADLVALHVHQERVGEVEVAVADLAREIVPDPKGEIEAIEALGGEGGQVSAPEIAIVVPGLVLHVGDEEACDTAHRVGGGFDYRRIDAEAVLVGALSQFEEGVDQAPRIGGADRETAGGGSNRERLGGAAGRGGDRDAEGGVIADGEAAAQFGEGPMDGG